MYGEEIKYSIDLLEYSDKESIQLFSCGNDKIDHYIKNEIFNGSTLNIDDGLHFKICKKNTTEIIGFYSLAISGIIHKVDNYMHVLPAVKIDVFAIDKKYQKLHFNEESELSEKDHYYFSDQILCEVIRKCRDISESQLLINFIILYAAKDAVKFYTRIFFSPFKNFMEPETNSEVNSLEPMYMPL